MPEGDQWHYEYSKYFVADHMADHLQKVTTPTGGVITYEFDTFPKGCGLAGKIQAGVSKKTVDTVNVNETWKYKYGNSTGENGDYTTITEQNSGRSTKYIFYGLGTTYGNDCYKYGLMQSKTTTEAGLTEKTIYSWDRLDNSISPKRYSPICACSQQGIYVPVLVEEKNIIDGTVYTTTYEHYNNYGDPRIITESGNAKRTTTKTYWKNENRNMVKGFPSSVSISGDSVMPDNFNSTYEYYTHNESSFGKLKKAVEYGIPTTYGYDSYGNLAWSEDANGHRTTYGWSNGTVSNIDNPIYTVSRVINWDGTIRSETNGRGHITKYAYDRNMRLTLIDPPAGNSTRISYLYDAKNNLKGKNEKRGGFWKKSFFDGLGRTTKTVDTLGVTTTTHYRPSGRKLFTKKNIGDSVFFDALGRIKKVQHRDNTEKKYSYDNNANVKVYDEANRISRHRFRYLGNPGEQYLYYVNNQRNEITRYTYNTLGSLLKTSRAGVVRTFSYDESNLLKSEHHPESGTTSYSRYANGNLKTKRENGKTITYRYDALNRLRKAVSGSYSQSFNYDKSDNVIRMTSKGVRIDQGFDRANRLRFRKSTINGKSGRIRYAYDGNDNIKKITYPSGLAVNYDYRHNQVTKAHGFGGSLTNIRYYTNAPLIGLLKSYRRGNGQTMSFSWDKRRRMYTSRNHVGATNKLKLDYRYDSRGNMKQLRRHPGRNQSFDYDAVNRMIRADGPWERGFYTYDANDNRRKKVLGGKTTKYHYSSSNKLTSETGRSYSYRGANIRRMGNHHLLYDPFDNIHTSKRGNTVVGRYLYDANNNRVYKKTGCRAVYYHYGQNGNVLSELNASGSGLVDYIYLNNMLVARSSAKQS